MKNPLVNHQVQQKLNEFEELEYGSPSRQWQESLLFKLSTVEPREKKSPFNNKVLAVVIICMLLNMGLVARIILRSKEGNNQRADRLQMISNEFFVDPISLKN